jgi:hypothetical protein
MMTHWIQRIRRRQWRLGGIGRIVGWSKEWNWRDWMRRNTRGRKRKVASWSNWKSREIQRTKWEDF